MPKKKQEKILCVEALRHSEYYGMQEIFDDLYAKSAAGEKFTDLMDLILSRENILLAYRNIKAKDGTDKYQNLVLILLPVHKLIHATQESTIAYYLKILNLDEKQLAKVNEYREKAGNAKI